MKKVSIISFLTCLVLLVSSLCLPVSAFAANGDSTDNTTAETPPVQLDSIVLTTEFPRIDAPSSGVFEYNVTLNYKGEIQRVFDLRITSPSGWEVYVEPSFETGKKISSITIDSSFSGMSKNVKVTAKAPSYPIPDPGDYKILFQATSGNVTGSLELVARISAKYALYVVPVNQLYNTEAQAGKNNIYSIQVSNTGTALLEGITFSSTHAEGWEITFSPDKLETMKASDMSTIDVNIKPPPKTVAGDYMIRLQISGKQVAAETMDIRVTVKTPTIWGWVGIIIIIIVVVGLFFIIMRFGRR